MAIGNYLTTEDVANELGVTTGRVRQFVMRNRLKPVEKIGQVLFFTREEVDKFREIPRNPGRPKSEE